jgi:hypothetical protein
VTTRDERSLGELFAELSRETSELFRKEVALAKAELSQKATQAGVDIGFLAAGGAIAYAGLLALVAAVILLLGEAIPMWLSALIVGLLVAAAGGLLVRQGMQRLKQLSPAPEQTIDTLKEDAEWLKNQTR